MTQPTPRASGKVEQCIRRRRVGCSCSWQVGRQSGAKVLQGEGFRLDLAILHRRAMVQGCLIASIGYASAGVTVIFKSSLKSFPGKHHAAQPARPLCLHWFDCAGKWVGVHAPCSDNH